MKDWTPCNNCNVLSTPKCPKRLALPRTVNKVTTDDDIHQNPLFRKVIMFLCGTLEGQTGRGGGEMKTRGKGLTSFVKPLSEKRTV